MHALAGSQQAILQFAQRVLPGAYHDVVDGQHLRLAFANADVQAVVVDAQVLHAVEHLHVFVLQTGPVDPAGGFAQAVAHFAGFALQQKHLARRCMHLGLDPGHAAACLKTAINAPLAPKRFAVLAGGLALLHQELGHVKANAARTDHRDAGTHRLALQNHVQVAEHFRVVDPGNRRGTRGNAGGQDDFIKFARHQLLYIHAGIEPQLNAGGAQFVREVAQGFVELFFARHALGHIELAADFTGRVKQRDLMPALSGYGGRREPRRPGTDHGDFLHGNGRQVVEFGFVAGPRVDQATGQLAAEGVVQTRLIAANAGVDFVAATGGGFVDELRVGQKRARHGDHVGIAFGEDLLGDFRRVDAVGGNQRHADRTSQLGGDFAERAARHFGGDGRNARFVPADPGVDQGHASLLHSLGQLHDFFPDAATGH